jgi:hypothetical protein
MATTIYKISEEILRIVVGGNSTVASKIHLNDVKLAVGQICNTLLKTDYLQINLPTGEVIPNGAMVGLYENVKVTKYLTKSRCKLPIKPVKLPRNIGVLSIFSPLNPDSEYIPLEMGQAALLQNQPLINDLLGQTGYSVFGDDVVFTKDITIPNVDTFVSMRLVIMDISQYGDWDILPIEPSMEWTVKQEAVKMFIGEPVADKLVDPSVKEQKTVPVTQQNQS